MKRFCLILLAVTLAVMTVVSCKKEQPEPPEPIYTNDLFADACHCLFWTVLGSNTDGALPWMQFWSGYLSESKNNQYGQLGTPSRYTPIAQIYTNAIAKLDEVINMNKDPNQQNLPNVLSLGSNANQIAAAKTLEAYYYMFLTDMMGPIVITNTFQGKPESSPLAYSDQRKVYTLLDDVLKEAYLQFNTSESLYKLSDIAYAGDIAKWKKLNASIRMLLAIKLCDVDPASGKYRFAEAYGDGGMTAVADGLDYYFGNRNQNPLYKWCSNSLATSDKNLVPNMILVDEMKKLKDPRMFAYFDIEGYKGTRDESSFPRKKYTSFYGEPFGLATDADVTAFSNVVCSINSKLLGTSAKIPVIPAARILFVEAEAAYRGWISADAKALYEAGIKASFSQWKASGVSSYLVSSGVAYYSGTALEQIAAQRWIASYMSDGVEVWSDWRRTNIPKLPVGPAAVAKGIDQYPYRLKFNNDPSTKYTSIQLDAAIKDLRGETDDVTSRLWWDVMENSKSTLTDSQCQPPALP